MKKIAFVISFILVLSNGIFAQDADFIQSTLKPLLEKQDATGLARHMAAVISLNIPDNKGITSKDQAKKKLADFFNTLSEPKFKMLESGKTTDKNASYLIGNLTSQSQSFRLYMLIQSSKNQIQSIDISPIP
jgi:hypothetical protein